MGVKDYLETTRVALTMPYEMYARFKNKDDIQLLSMYDTDMYQHYKTNEEWQQAYEEYKLAKDKKQDVEYSIRYELYAKGE